MIAYLVQLLLERVRRLEIQVAGDQRAIAELEHRVRFLEQRLSEMPRVIR